MKGEIFSASTNLDNLLTDYKTSTQNLISDGEIKIQTWQVTIDTQLTQLKEYAQTNNLNIQDCLRTNEPYLNGLPASMITYMTNCTKSTDVEGSDIIDNSKYLVDIIYTRVDALEFQITLCTTEACVEPIIELINLESINLPNKVGIEVTRANDLFDILKLTAQDCQDESVAKYVSHSNIVIQEVSNCVNNK